MLRLKPLFNMPPSGLLNKKRTFPLFLAFGNLIGMGPIPGASTLGSFMVPGLRSSLLLLLRGFGGFLAFGVWGDDATAFLIILGPLLVLCSTHTTCS